jgi:hypothetical protein
MSGQDELTGRTGDTRTRIAEDMDTEVADALSVAVITRWIVDMLILGSAKNRAAALEREHIAET